MRVSPLAMMSFRRWGLALGTAGLVAVANPARAQLAPAPPPSAEAPAPQTGQDSPGLVFGSDAGVVINTVRDDRTAAFEEVIGKLHQALSRSANPVRKQQLAGWKVFRAVERGSSGAVYYFFVMDPVVKDADYGMAKILTEAFPEEARAILDKLSGAAVGSNRLSLQKVAPFGQ